MNGDVTAGTMRLCRHVECVQRTGTHARFGVEACRDVVENSILGPKLLVRGSSADVDEPS